MKKRDKDRLRLWQDRLRRANAAYEPELSKMDGREELYQGCNRIRPIVCTARKRETPHVRNLCAEHGISVLWTTHLLDEVQANDALMILHQGRLVASGQVDELIQQQGGDLGSVFARLTRPTVTGAAA